jgi:hypothetical protein
MQASWLVVYRRREQGRSSPVILLRIYWVPYNWLFPVLQFILMLSPHLFSSFHSVSCLQGLQVHFCSCLIICFSVEGTTHFVGIHLKLSGKCLRRIWQKRLLIKFCSMILYYLIMNALNSHHHMIWSVDHQHPICSLPGLEATGRVGWAIWNYQVHQTGIWKASKRIASFCDLCILFFFLLKHVPNIYECCKGLSFRFFKLAHVIQLGPTS